MIIYSVLAHDISVEQLLSSCPVLVHNVNLLCFCTQCHGHITKENYLVHVHNVKVEQLMSNCPVLVNDVRIVRPKIIYSVYLHNVRVVQMSYCP